MPLTKISLSTTIPNVKRITRAAVNLLAVSSSGLVRRAWRLKPEIAKALSKRFHPHLAVILKNSRLTHVYLSGW